MERKKDDPDQLAVALLHDVLEDQRDTDEESFRHKFGERVYRYVKLLTKLDWRSLPGGDEEERKRLRDDIYFKGLESAPHDVLTVKLADRANNLERLLDSPVAGKKERYVRETIDRIRPLAKKHSAYFFDSIDMRLIDLEYNIKKI
jgi:(p)ppGpp synthase/HD superfamily hydrolase